MPKYYSPNGNFEIWTEKPDGYFTAEEWLAAHPIEDAAPDLETERARVLAEIKIAIAATDYKCLKFVDGTLSEDEYTETRTHRAALRAIYSTVEAATEISQITAIWPEVS